MIKIKTSDKYPLLTAHQKSEPHDLARVIIQGLFIVIAVSGIATSVCADDQAYQLRKATQRQFRSVVEKIRPSLVRIDTVGGTQPGSIIQFDDEGKPIPKSVETPFNEQIGSDFVVADGPTTGLIYSSDGYIIAGSFNFIREPALISITLHDGRRLAADLIARDHVRKLALLKIDAHDLITPEWAYLHDVRVGQWAMALGMGFGGDEPSVTIGIVSAMNRMRGNAIQTDAKLSPVNYGGPLCDIHGRVIGISVPMAQRPGELAGVEMYDSGVGFAVPYHLVWEIVDEMMTGRSFYRGWLGIQINSRSINGLIVTRVADPSPMREAGVRPGDVITSAEGRVINHFGNLVQTLYMIPAGETVHVCFDRRDKETDKITTFSVDIKLARNTELGYLPEQEQTFDPSNPFPDMEDDE